MKATKLNEVLVIIKSNKKLIGAIFIVVMVIFFSSIISEKIQIEKAKKEMALNELEKNKEIIFFNSETIKNKDKIETINTKIEYLNKDLDATKTYDECVKAQIGRIGTDLLVSLDYCEKFSQDLEIIEEEKTILSEPKIVYNLKSDIDVIKEILFLCKEVGAKNPNRCATYGTLVFNYESGNGTSRRYLEDNNGFGIKNPTDKKGLKWDYKIWTGRHIIFTTKEIGTYAFAYYYSNYHTQRNSSEFVNKWAGWNNEKYIAYIEQNYDDLYNKYENFLNFTK